MNFDLLLQRLIGRATCQTGHDVIFARSARVRNIAGRSKCISVGSHTRIMGELLTFAHGGQIVIGDWCYIGEGSRIWSAVDIRIDDRVLISHNVNIFDSLTHPIHAAERHNQIRRIFGEGHPREIDLDERPVVIENDVWIGAGAFVMRGVKLHRGSVVAAGAVVTKDVPAYTIVAGNPAVIVRELSPDER